MPERGTPGRPGGLGYAFAPAEREGPSVEPQTRLFHWLTGECEAITEKRIYCELELNAPRFVDALLGDFGTKERRT